MPISTKTPSNGSKKIVSNSSKAFSDELPDSIQNQPAPASQAPTVPIGKLLVFVIIISFLAGAIGSVLITQAGFSSTSNIFKKKQATNSASGVQTQTLSVLEESQTIDVVSTANPSVVSIIITKDLSKVYNNSNDLFGNPFFFSTPEGAPQGKQQVGGGSGFIIGEDGLIVTNKHVVSDDEAEYTVLTNDRKSYTAKVVATDPSNDLAFVKIEPTENLPVLTLGDSSTLQIGESVIAIGNALGEYRNTVTKGIVSGLARTVSAGDGQGTQETLDNVIQTDAAINPGNSGGPLLNLSGQVVGINTAINQSGQLIGFAIPVNEIKKAVDSVKTVGKIVRPMLGVRYVMITDELAKQNDLQVSYGALLVKGSSRTEPAVVADSPADRAGLVEDDIILEINGTKLEGDKTLSSVIQEFKPNDQVTIKYLHNKEEKSATIKLDELPSS